MSTHSTISIEHKNGSIETIYCHWDGYISWNGRILVENYINEDLVKELISNGDLSSLGEKINPDPSKPHTFRNGQEGVCIYYHRDAGEKLSKVKPKISANFDLYKKRLTSDYDSEYNYLFRNGSWFVSKYHGENFIELPNKLTEQIIKKIESQLNERQIFEGFAIAYKKIQRIHELSQDTYRNAINKLKKLGQNNLAKKMSDHAAVQQWKEWADKGIITKMVLSSGEIVYYQGVDYEMAWENYILDEGVNIYPLFYRIGKEDLTPEEIIENELNYIQDLPFSIYYIDGKIKVEEYGWGYLTNKKDALTVYNSLKDNVKQLNSIKVDDKFEEDFNEFKNNLIGLLDNLNVRHLYK